MRSSTTNWFGDVVVTSLQLCAGQSLLLVSPEQLGYLRLDVNSGYSRLAASSHDGFGDITLAFIGEGELYWLRLPPESSCWLEAITQVDLVLDFARFPGGTDELIADWLLALRRLVQIPQAEARLDAFFRLLVFQFGQRTSSGYRLPFLLSHGRLAEVIGCTRSTVTRRLSQLRDLQLMSLVNGPPEMLFSACFIEGD